MAQNRAFAPRYPQADSDDPARGRGRAEAAQVAEAMPRAGQPAAAHPPPNLSGLDLSDDASRPRLPLRGAHARQRNAGVGEAVGGCRGDDDLCHAPTVRRVTDMQKTRAFASAPPSG